MSTDHASTRPSRVSPGTPAGGQFASQSHAESPVRLEPDETTSPVPEDGDRPVPAWVAKAVDSARFWSRRYDMADRSVAADSEDVAQDALVALLERQASGDQVTDPEGYIHGTARRMAAKSGSGLRAEDRKALAELRMRADALRQELGREPTGPETDEIAETIRANWPDPRHRPTAGFHTIPQHETSLDGLGEAAPGAVEAAASRSAPGQTCDDEPAPDSTMGRALAADPKRASKLMWNALAEYSDAPMPTPGSLSSRQVTACRAEMAAGQGGVLAAADRWETGDDDEATAALMAPFPDASATQQQAVVDALRFRPEHAQLMWESALYLANTRHVTDQ